MSGDVRTYRTSVKTELNRRRVVRGRRQTRDRYLCWRARRFGPPTVGRAAVIRAQYSSRVYVRSLPFFFSTLHMDVVVCNSRHDDLDPRSQAIRTRRPAVEFFTGEIRIFPVRQHWTRNRIYTCTLRANQTLEPGQKLTGSEMAKPLYYFKPEFKHNYPKPNQYLLHTVLVHARL